MDLEKQIRQKVGVPSQKEALSLVPRIQEHLISPERLPKSTQYPDLLEARPLRGPRSLVDHYQSFEDEDMEEPQELMEEPQPKETKSPRRKKHEQPQAE